MVEIILSMGVSFIEKEKVGIERIGFGYVFFMEGDVCVNRGVVDYDFERQKLVEGEVVFYQFGWKCLMVVFIVIVVVLGSFSFLVVFVLLGMIFGVIIFVSMGFLVMYCSYVVGQVKVKYFYIVYYIDVGRMMFGKWGYIIMMFMFVLQFIFIIVFYVLMGVIMFGNLINNGVCIVVFVVVLGIFLFFLVILFIFFEMVIFGYVDFVFIIGVIGVIIIVIGIQLVNVDGGLVVVSWFVYFKEGLMLYEGFIVVINIVFVYSYLFCQFSFMDEMYILVDYFCVIFFFGIFEIFFYIIIGVFVFVFVGYDVQVFVFFLVGFIMFKVVFGVVLFVIYIFGSINMVVCVCYIYGKWFKDLVICYVNIFMGWIIWIGVDVVIIIVVFVVVEVIFFFLFLLVICVVIFLFGFIFYFLVIMWFMFIKEGKWMLWNIMLGVFNVVVFIVGMVIFGFGIYLVVKDIIICYEMGVVGIFFGCVLFV